MKNHAKTTAYWRSTQLFSTSQSIQVTSSKAASSDGITTPLAPWADKMTCSISLNRNQLPSPSCFLWTRWYLHQSNIWWETSIMRSLPYKRATSYLLTRTSSDRCLVKMCFLLSSSLSLLACLNMYLESFTKKWSRNWSLYLARWSTTSEITHLQCTSYDKAN